MSTDHRTKVRPPDSVRSRPEDIAKGWLLTLAPGRIGRDDLWDRYVKAGAPGGYTRSPAYSPRPGSSSRRAGIVSPATLGAFAGSSRFPSPSCPSEGPLTRHDAENGTSGTGGFVDLLLRNTPGSNVAHPVRFTRGTPQVRGLRSRRTYVARMWHNVAHDLEAAGSHVAHGARGVRSIGPAA
jgi:hypothetical protein